MESYLILDISILLFIVLSAFFSFMRGFSQEILALISWVLSFFGSYKYGENFANSLNKLIDNIVISSIASYVITFIIFMIVLSLITKSFSNLIKKSYIGLVDRTGGFLFGLLRGYLIVAYVFLLFITFIMEKKLYGLKNQNLIL